jgi:hypothetical protein
MDDDDRKEDIIEMILATLRMWIGGLFLPVYIMAAKDLCTAILIGIAEIFGYVCFIKYKPVLFLILFAIYTFMIMLFAIHIWWEFSPRKKGILKRILNFVYEYITCLATIVLMPIGCFIVGESILAGILASLFGYGTMVLLAIFQLKIFYIACGALAVFALAFWKFLGPDLFDREDQKSEEKKNHKEFRADSDYFIGMDEEDAKKEYHRLMKQY